MKVRWVFHGGDEIYILFPTLNVTVNCLDLTYIRNSHREGWLSSEIHIQEIHMEEA